MIGSFIPILFGALLLSALPDAGESDRDYWVRIADKLGRPVLAALGRRELRRTLPVQGKRADTAEVAPLEATARVLCGLTPWIELGGDGSREGRLRAEMASLARDAVDAATDPASPYLMPFTGPQSMVEAAFLCQAILRAPTELWAKLPDPVRANVVDRLIETRSVKPFFSNWLLFSAMVETGLFHMGYPGWDRMRIDYALRQHEQWYKGDGAYGDGPAFRWDYYNSFVIQPMLLDILRAVGGEDDFGPLTYDVALRRARRWAAVQERLISPEGTFPPIGRSLAYRFGALHGLAQIALLGALPDGVAPAQVRGAMNAVIRRTMEAPGTFDHDGWLRTGFCGDQPDIGDHYVSTGSLYLCAAGLLPLGLAPSDPFWTDPPAPWTARKAWSGEDIPPDHALHD
jgi:hypothetical protein